MKKMFKNMCKKINAFFSSLLYCLFVKFICDVCVMHVVCVCGLSKKNLVK